MDKMKRFIDCYIDTENCNFRCHYCYVGQKREFYKKLFEIEYTPEFIRKALSIERLGGKCLLNFCAGGETLLSPYLLNVIKALLEEGHYIMIVTNGTCTNRFEEISQWDIELKKRLFFKFSFHFLELKRLNLFDVFWNNVKNMRKSGCSFTVEITPNDELIPYIEDVKNQCLQNVGALPHVTITRNEQVKEFVLLSKLSWDDFIKTWSVFNSKMFEHKAELFGEKRKEFCYAGEWSAVLVLSTGNISYCTYEPTFYNIYKNVDEKIPFKPLGKRCSMAHCYNSHAWLTLGSIPQLKTPTFADVRDRVDVDGNHWLQPEFRSFISQKLKDNNKQYYGVGKYFARTRGRSLKQRLAQITWLRKLVRKIKHKD